MVYNSASEIDFDLTDVPAASLPRNALFTRPEHFAVEYAINPHMEGNLGTVDSEAAMRQWDMIRRLYESLGMQTSVVDGVSGLPDMVFCANQTLPYLTAEGTKGVVLSHMYAPQRAPEVDHYRSFFAERGYAVHTLPSSVSDFEGMGDALWHPGRLLLWGGFGFRSSLSAYEHIAELLDVRVLAVHLHDPDFYHLDTCLSLLDEKTALIFAGAFEEEGLRMIRRVIPRLLYAPENESRSLLACNAHCPDGHNVIIQAGCHQTVSMLRSEGYNPIEVRTEEFLKAGGSVFCMKQMFW